MTTTSKNIEAIVKQWTSFDLKSIQHDLDVTTTEIASRADESDQSRRKLVELSRDFKKNTNEDVRKAVAPILKSFQIEIDSLSKRSKAAEKAFLEIYRHLSELPDPVPALDYAQSLQRRAEKVSDLEIENQKLRETLDEYNHEFADVKNQEVTLKQLRDKIKDLEEKTESTVQQRIKEKEKEFQRIFGEKERQLQNQQFDLVTKYAEMEMRQSQLQSNLDHAHQEMFEYKSKQEDSNSARLSEIDILNQDLERANERASNAERLVDKLREQLDQTRTLMTNLSAGNYHNNNNSSSNNSDEMQQEEIERKLREKLELELAAKEREIAALVVDTQKLQSTLIKVRETSCSQIADLESMLTSKEKVITQLENRLQNLADYDEIKRELTILKSIEFSSSSHRSNEDSTGSNLPKKSLEMLLLEKNRTLQNEQTQIKVAHVDLESNTNQHQQQQHSCRHCSSPCLHRSNTPSFLPVSSLLSSSSSSSSSSSPQTYLKTHSPHMNACNGTEDMTRSLTVSPPKFIPPLPPPPPVPSSTTTNQSYISLSAAGTDTSSPSKYPLQSITSTMVTPTASLLSSVISTMTPSSLYPGSHVSSVQCTKLHCSPSSSWSPPLLSAASTSSTSTDSNTVNRTVGKSSKQSSPKPSPSPSLLVPSTYSSSMPTNNNTLEPLDTTYVAGVVRKLLAQHNIGQRIFARYILSLSQGTVSELLSKPKCWTKLTEKGKESYRKMWCWANSEESILTLKSISPRKGMNNRSKDNAYPSVSSKHTDPVTQQKIVQILADAQKQQQQQQQLAAAAAAANVDQKPTLSPDSPNDLSSSAPTSSTLDQLLLPKNYLSRTPSTSSSSSGASSSANEPNSKLSDQPFFLPGPTTSVSPASSSAAAAAASLSMLSAFVPSLLMGRSGVKSEPGTSGLVDRSIASAGSSPFSLLCPQPDNYRNWLMLQEIVRNNDLLKQLKPPLLSSMTTSSLLAPPSETNESEDEDDDEDVENEPERGDEAEDDDDDDDDEDEENRMTPDEIPLDLSMKFNLPNHNNEQPSPLPISTQKKPPNTNTKHIKSALPPLRDNDTFKYRYVNTMELVQTVKDILSRYSISQRHFGEKILGLSQGSVSDILARPKQWELLTQKGREPFLRMRLFLDDPHAIEQLVQSVSATSTTSTSSILLPASFCPPTAAAPPPPPPPPPPPLPSTPLVSNGFHSSNLLLRDSSIDSTISNECSNLLSSTDTIIVPPSNGASNSKSKSRSKVSKINNGKTSTNQSRQQQSDGIPALTPYELPKILMPTVIDTEQLSSQVRELLFAYSIGQRVFGEAVLNLSQGTVSEILSKPRPWHSLSVKGREPYMRMYSWYHDSGNVQKLLAWKRERDALRRTRSLATTTVSGDVESSSGISTIANSTINRPKRRCLFTDDQRRILKQIFENEPYPSQATLEQLVGELSLPMNKIANWFHNSRMRAKTGARPTSPLGKISTPPPLASTDEPSSLVPSDDEDLDNNDSNDYPPLPTIVPLTSSWLNGTTDSNSAPSPLGPSSSSTQIVSLIDDAKNSTLPSPSSSSKKRKSVPQKIVAGAAKKFSPNAMSILENDRYSNVNNNSEEVPPPPPVTSLTTTTTNETSNLVDVLT